MTEPQKELERHLLNTISRQLELTEKKEEEEEEEDDA
jgi:hypothetical protein